MAKIPVSTRRHSASHVLAAAVLQMFPEAKLGTGPDTDTGFYYDFLLPRPLIPEDLPILQEKMTEIMKKQIPFEYYEEPIDKAKEFLKTIGQDFKVELVAKFEKNENVKKVSFYKNGDFFVDLCEGPHVEHTGQIGAFKLTHFAGAYWQGDSERDQMTRIYGLGFASDKELRQHEAMLEEAKKRDHRKIGKELDLFAFDEEVGPGLPLWLPKGAVIVEELEKLAKKMEAKYDYVRVRSPHIAKEALYIRSGHLPYYAEDMFPPMDLDNEKYYLKAMNCPHHHKIFAATPKSYRDLPIRMAEYGHCYRYEDSGALFGLMRVRSLCMNDAHIYCTEEQFEAEFQKVIDMYLEYFKIFGINKYEMRLSKHLKEGLGKKYVDEPELWIKTEDLVRKALEHMKVPFTEVEDEAAFYGPKIDVQIWSAIGREFTLATNQLDFAVPKRFDLTYTDVDGKEHTPICIHRAPLSTHERMIGFLIEHYAGAFPFWLAPVQVQILPISEAQNEYTQKVYQELKQNEVRVEISKPDETLGKRIREGQMKKVPYLLVVGEKEVEEKTVTVRQYGEKAQEAMSVSDFLKKTNEA